MCINAYTHIWDHFRGVQGCVFFSGLLRFLDSSIRHQGNSVGADGDASNLLGAYGGFLKLGVLLKIPKVHQF